MKSMFRKSATTLAMTAVLGLAGMQSAGAVELLTNGNFEAGSFAGWTVTDLAGGSGTWFIDTPGTTTPLSGATTSGAGGGAHGSFYAVTDQTGPGTHILRQSFTTTAGGKVMLEFDMFVNDYDSGPIVNGAGLTHTAGANQHGRVDILTAGAGAFDTGGTVLANYYLGVDAGVDPHGFTHYSFDITGIVGGGGTFQIRFAEVDNQLFLNMGVDNVTIDQDIPEPASLALIGLGLAAAGLSRRRRRA